jgi:hypothetical protein
MSDFDWVSLLFGVAGFLMVLWYEYLTGEKKDE